MTDMLSIGASGVRAYQSALTTTSDNIANAGTTGYARRTTQIREVSVVGGVAANVSGGLGVTVDGVVRSADASRAAAVRTTGSDLAKSETGAAWLDRIQTSLTADKLGDRLTAFFTAATGIAADPGSLAPRATMLEAASSLAASFAATGSGLDAAMADLDASADAATGQLNSLSAALAQVNAGLGRSSAGTAGMASLLDRRDQLLEQMSAITDLSVTFDAAGRAAVRAGGGAGPMLVQGDTANTVTYVRGSEGAVSFAVHGNGTQALSPTGGALAGIAEGAQRIADAQAAVSDLAQRFADGVNAVQAAGEDLTGTAGAAMFAVGDPPYKLTLTLSDPRGIAAAAPGGGTRSNGNIAGLTALRTAGAFEGGVTDLVAGNGAALSSRNAVADAQSAIHDAAVAQRDAVSGVSIDEEAVDLLRFQQAYQASSRVIQIARETLQSILDIR